MRLGARRTATRSDAAPPRTRAAPAVPAAVGTVRVRAATLGDLDAVVRLRLALLREHAASPIYGRLHREADELARPLFAAQLTSPTEVTWLAERDGGVVGMLRCVESLGSPLLVPARYGYVSSVYVLPATRRRGVLRTLLAAAEDWCRARGLDEIRLHSAARHGDSGAAWDALGFDVVEQLRRRAIPRR